MGTQPGWDLRTTYFSEAKEEGGASIDAEEEEIKKIPLGRVSSTKKGNRRGYEARCGFVQSSRGNNNRPCRRAKGRPLNLGVSNFGEGGGGRCV